MKALFNNQLERYKERWYRTHNQIPPNLGSESKSNKQKTKSCFTTKTYVVDGFDPGCVDGRLDISYWDTQYEGIEPFEFFASRNTLKSDTVVGWEPLPQVQCGEINDCFTPYENDIMSYGAFETMRMELKHRAIHLANEMERVDVEFNRPPNKKWFCLKGPEFTLEHIRYNELKRREHNVW